MVSRRHTAPMLVLLIPTPHHTHRPHPTNLEPLPPPSQPDPPPVIRTRPGLATASTPPCLVVANCQSHSAADQMVFPLNPRRRHRSSAASRGPGLRPHFSDAAQWGRNAPPRRAQPATTNARTRRAGFTRSHSRPCTIRVPVPPTNRHAKPPFMHPGPPPALHSSAALRVCCVALRCCAPSETAPRSTLSNPCPSAFIRG